MEHLDEHVAAHGLEPVARSATLAQMQGRLGSIRAWLMALTALQAAQLGGLVAILLRQ
jgi:hypothetical protein